MIILLYVMDSLRADFLSCCGYAKETSPNIDRLAREGVLFTNAFAQSTWTRSSGASLLTSAYPSVHGVITLKDFLSPSVPTLQERLKENGFVTMAISAMGNISPYFGFSKGFDLFIELYKEDSVIQRRHKVKKRSVGWEKHFKVETEEVPVATSEDINQFLFPFLKQHREENLFLLIWSIDTHDPFFQRDPQLTRFAPPSNEILWSKEVDLRDPKGGIDRLKVFYEDMIYYNDYQIGNLVERLKELKLYDETFLILTSDHGEAFGEHGYKSHGGTPYDELIKVPLIMKFPHSQFSGQVSDLVQHIDVAPTILEHAGVTGNEMVLQGKSLLPSLRKEAKGNSFVFVETQLSDELPRCTALRDSDYKYVEIEREKFTFRKWVKERGILWPLAWIIFKPRLLFCVRDDAGEKNNIVLQERRIAEDFRSRINFIRRNNLRKFRGLGREKKGKLELDEGVVKQLRGLGYFD